MHFQCDDQKAQFSSAPEKGEQSGKVKRGNKHSILFDRCRKEILLTLQIKKCNCHRHTPTSDKHLHKRNEWTPDSNINKTENLMADLSLCVCVLCFVLLHEKIDLCEWEAKW